MKVRFWVAYGQVVKHEVLRYPGVRTQDLELGTRRSKVLVLGGQVQGLGLEDRRCCPARPFSPGYQTSANPRTVQRVILCYTLEMQGGLLHVQSIVTVQGDLIPFADLNTGSFF